LSQRYGLVSTVVNPGIEVRLCANTTATRPVPTQLLYLLFSVAVDEKQ
jgi:hypothetical protein